MSQQKATLVNLNGVVNTIEEWGKSPTSVEAPKEEVKIEEEPVEELAGKKKKK